MQMEMVLDPPADMERELPTETAPARPMQVPPICQPVVDQVLVKHRDYQRFTRSKSPRNGTLRDIVFATPADPHQPDEVFGKLRWGGLYVFASPKRKQVVELSSRLVNYGFALESPPTYVRAERRWCPLPFLNRKIHTLVARKVRLLPPGGTTD